MRYWCQHLQVASLALRSSRPFWLHFSSFAQCRACRGNNTKGAMFADNKPRLNFEWLERRRERREEKKSSSVARSGQLLEAAPKMRLKLVRIIEGAFLKLDLKSTEPVEKQSDVHDKWPTLNQFQPIQSFLFLLATTTRETK